MTINVTQSLMNWSNTVSSNTTNFREFVSRWTDLFSLSGWVNTNASGSIDTASVAATGNNVIAGYQVWRFNDTLHNNGFPVYVKVEYGGGAVSSGTNSSAGLWLSVGFRHDGTASISQTGVNGVGSTPRGVGIYVIGDPSTRRTLRLCCISGSDTVGIMGEDSTSTNNSAFSVERTKDINGNSTNEGVVVSYMNTHGGWFRTSHMLYSYSTSSYVPVEDTIPNYILSNGHASYGNDVTLGMFIPILSSSFGYPSRMLGIVNGSSLTQNTTHILNLFGTSSVYFIHSSAGPNGSGGNRGRSDDSGNFRWIMRYE